MNRKIYMCKTFHVHKPYIFRVIFCNLHELFCEVRFFQKTLHSHDWQTENDSTNQKQHWLLLTVSWRRCLLEEPHLPTITVFSNSTSIRLSNMVCLAFRSHGESTATTRYMYPFVHLDSQVFEIHFVKNFIIAIILVALISYWAGMFRKWLTKSSHSRQIKS